MMSAISVTGITKTFGKKKVLDGVSLEIGHGEAYALLGENGAGKTTLIRTIAGLLEPDSGSVRVCGVDPLHSTGGFVAGVAFVSERRGVYPWLSVREAIAFAREITPGWVDEEEASLLKRLKLDPASRVGDLSRGEIGKLCLLTALAARPKILVMDEPTAGLDPLVRRTFLEEVIAMMLDEGRTVLYSTHELHEAERIAQRVGILFGGRLILESGIDDLRRSHRTVSATLPECNCEKTDGPWPCAEVERSDGAQQLPFALRTIPGLIACRETAGRLFMDFSGWTEETAGLISAAGLTHIEIQPVSLEDIFCMYGEKEGQR